MDYQNTLRLKGIVAKVSDIKGMASEIGIGEPTLKDILKEMVVLSLRL